MNYTKKGPIFVCTHHKNLSTNKAIQQKSGSALITEAGPELLYYILYTERFTIRLRHPKLSNGENQLRLDALLFQDLPL